MHANELMKGNACMHAPPHVCMPFAWQPMRAGRWQTIKRAASSGIPADERVKEAGEGAGLRQEFRAGFLSAGGRLPLKWNEQ